jgi:hypothetical protein
MFGDDGVDTLYGEVGAIRLGGTGNDTLDGGTAGHAEGRRARTLYGDIGGQPLRRVGNDYFSGLGRDQLFGEDGTDVCKGGWRLTAVGRPQRPPVTRHGATRLMVMSATIFWRRA